MSKAEEKVGKSIEDESIHAARIERMADQACAKISEHANRAASRVIEVIDESKSSIATIEKTIGAALRKAETQGTKIDVQAKDFDAIKKKLAGIGDAVDDVEARITKARGFIHGVCDIIGKTVCLKSGGLTMTAAALDDDGGILCVWADTGGVYQQSIPLAALEIVEFSSRDGWQAQDGATAYAARDLQGAGAHATYTKASEQQGASKVAP